jgi:hypothetical protein
VVRSLIRFLKRPVAWGAVLLSYAGVIIALIFAGFTANGNDADIRAEAAVREHDICTVIIAVNKNAKFRARTEKHRIETTEAFLRDTARSADSANDTDSRALRNRVKQTLPLVKADYRTAKQNVRATTPPPICRKYLNQERK